jgi:hypothetical protein
MKKCTLILTGLALLLAGNASVNAQTPTQKITVTIAGSGMPGHTGDGGSARLAQVNGPKDICMDAADNMYFVNRVDGTIRRIDHATNIITTIGGGGSSLMDGIPATSAYLSPNYICANAAGDVFFTSWNQVRMISATTGMIATVAGSVTAGYSGDMGPAAMALLTNPQGIDVDATGNIYVVDRGNNCIRKISVSTGFITTLIGSTTRAYYGDGGPAAAAMLNGPVCVAVEASGDVYFSDQNPNYPNYDNSVIRVIEAATGNVEHIAGALMVTGITFDCPATAAQLGTITGMRFEHHHHSGDLHCNEMSCSCRRIHRHHHHGHGHDGDDTLELVGGNFYSQSFHDDIMSNLGDMNIPYGLCLDGSGNVYVADSNNQRIRKIVQLSNTPAFAYGHGQYIDPTPGTAWTIDSLMWVADIDSGQTETWTIVTPPSHGTVAGFPATAISNGVYRTTKPTGLTYTGATSYTGPDMFTVRVTDDGGLSDIVTVYVGSNLVSLNANNINASTATVNIFPNPATSVLNIEWTDLQTGNSSVEIVDVADRLMYKTTLANTATGSMQVNVASFPAGVYVVRMNGMEVRKFVKQ